MNSDLPPLCLLKRRPPGIPVNMEVSGMLARRGFICIPGFPIVISKWKSWETIIITIYCSSGSPLPTPGPRQLPRKKEKRGEVVPLKNTYFEVLSLLDYSRHGQRIVFSPSEAPSVFICGWSVWPLKLIQVRRMCPKRMRHNLVVGSWKCLKRKSN